MNQIQKIIVVFITIRFAFSVQRVVLDCVEFDIEVDRYSGLQETEDVESGDPENELNKFHE
jgi:hypothetical protein